MHKKILTSSKYPLVRKRDVPANRRKMLAVSFLLSAAIHFAILLLCLYVEDRLSSRQRSVSIPVTLYPELPLSGTRWEQKSVEPEGFAGSGPKKAAPGVAEAASGNAAAASGSTAGTSMSHSLPEGIYYIGEPKIVPGQDTTQSLLFTWRRKQPSFKEALLGKIVSSPNPNEKVKSWMADQTTATGWTRPEPAADYLKKRSGQTPVIALNAARPPEDKKVEEHPLSLDFIPTPVQVMAMASVYRMKQPDQTEIYSNLDVQLPITAAGLDANLEFLVKKGLLKRKKVSPENKLGIGTLFGGTSIELSRKNALNPRYEYTALVDKPNLISYFQAQIFLLKDRLQSAPSDSFQVRRSINDLQNMLLMLIQST
ncbi:MAG TPA: hypothetical protein VGB38_06755 [bacterium]